VWFIYLLLVGLFCFDLLRSQYFTEVLFLLKEVFHGLFALCVKGSCKYIEKAAVGSRQGVVLVFRWEPSNLHRIKR
jgi:hypothetical protein